MEEIHINNQNTSQNLKVTQRIIQTHGYTVTLEFLGKRTAQECLEDILKSHFENNDENNFIN